MTKTTTPRFLALDVLRGLTICFMIIVNSPGSGATPFAPLEHAAWHGFTPTDLVFPTFLFVVGNAMSFTMPKYKAIGNGSVLQKIFKRTIIIFLLGYLMYWFPFFRESAGGGYEFYPISDTRILGVLQRIALAYCAASLLIHFLSRKAVWAVSVLLLVGYWVVMCAFGDYSMTGNAGHKLDLILFGESHLYHGEGVAFDPEGFLSTLPAIVNVIIGYYAGVFIQQKGKTYETVAKLALAGFVFISIAYFWDFLFPINKKLWTSSFVMYTTGLDLVLLAMLVFVCEIQNITRGTYFFQVFGKNPLFIYLLSEIIVITLFTIKTGSDTSMYNSINNVFFQRVLPGPWGSLAFAVSIMIICWLVGYWMDKKNIYIKV